jgi:hypothetical protein
MEELDHSLTNLGDVGSSSEDILGGALGDVVGEIGSVLDKIEPILDVLNKVKSMLG